MDNETCGLETKTRAKAKLKLRRILHIISCFHSEHHFCLSHSPNHWIFQSLIGTAGVLNTLTPLRQIQDAHHENYVIYKMCARKHHITLEIIYRQFMGELPDKISKWSDASHLTWQKSNKIIYLLKIIRWHHWWKYCW